MLLCLVLKNTSLLDSFITSCRYIAEVFCGSSNLLSQKCVCMCDDDNDVEMALGCLHAYIPSVSSDSLLQTIEENPTQFTLTSEQGRIEGTAATEAALSMILDRIRMG